MKLLLINLAICLALLLPRVLTAAIAQTMPATEPGLKHPVYRVESGGGSAEKLPLEFTEAQWLALVPKQSPRSVILSPVSGKGHWKWDPHNPDQITCGDSGVVFPTDDPRFPRKLATGQTLEGKMVQVPYYEGKAGPCFVQGQIDCEKKDYLDRCLLQLSAAYVATHDERFARRVALALDAWATVLPDYYISDHGGTAPITLKEAERRKWDVNRFSDHNTWAHEWPWGAVLAFDRVYDSKALAELSKEKGYDVGQHVAKDLFFNIGDFFAHRMPIETAAASNLSGPMVQLAQVATILSRPDYIEWLNRYLDVTLDNFLRDGMYPESFGYHRGYADANLAVAEAVGYYFTVHPADTDDLRAAKAASDQRIARLRQSVAVQYTVALPNGDMAPFDDTPLGAAPKREATRSSLLPAYGHAMLGDGNGPLQTQLNINFNDNANHIRAGVLGLTLYAFGRELIANNRYVHEAGRPFLNSTIAHNTVTIDRMSQERSTRQTEAGGNAGHLFTGGDLRLWEPGLNGIAVADIDGSRSYLNVPGSRYERLCVLNTIDAAHPYVLDVFRVGGGRTHDYFLHGSVRLDQKAEASFLLEALPGEHPLLLPGEAWHETKGQYDGNNDWYGAFRRMTRGKSPGHWNVTFRDTADKAGTRVTMADEDGDVFLGEGPVPGRGGDRVERETIFNYWRPALMVRRQASEGKTLQSLFVAVIEPFDGAPQIVKVERLPMRMPSSDAAAVRVTFANGRADTYLIDLAPDSGDGAEVATADAAVRLHGRVGLLSRRVGGTSQAWLIGGTDFHATESVRLSSKAYRGMLAAVARRTEGAAADAFVTEATLPEGAALKGRWLSLAFGKYLVIPAASGEYPLGIREQAGISQMFQIDHVDHRDGKTWICLSQDPFLAMRQGGLSELLRPHRSFEGPATFEIVPSVVFESVAH